MLCSQGGPAVTIYPSPAEVAGAAAGLILAAAARAIALRGRFQLVLAGGRTPLAVYAELARSPAEWAHWQLFFGDERCLGDADPGRNSVAAAQVWLDRVPIPAGQRHPIAAERGAPAAAAAYEALIAPRLPFDLVLLGLGEDGHTASLFPGQPVPEGPLVIPVRDAPKPPPARVSLTPRALAATEDLIFLATGADKAPALAAWRGGAALPAARVAALGRARLLVDGAAWGADPGDCKTADGRPAESVLPCVPSTNPGGRPESLYDMRSVPTQGRPR